MSAEQCPEAERQTWAWHAANPDGCAIDARDLAGYHPPSPLVTGDSDNARRDSTGLTLADWERAIASGRRPGRWEYP
jgi:hypothetical protein